jgi:hypothetical protein
MQDWLDHYFLRIFPFFFVASSILSMYLVAATGGWRLLARRFRLQGDFRGQKWRMQSARLRWLCNYNGCLTIGADETGLFMVPMLVFRAWHPPLFIPWVEISFAGSKTELFFFKLVELRLGRSENIPFKISAELAAKIEAAAGPAWPRGYTQASAAPPPPIG